MQTDWKGLAQAHRLDLTDEELARIVPALAGLEAAFRPLLSRIPYEIEPVLILSDAAVGGE